MLISEDNYILQKKLKDFGNQNAVINAVIIFPMKKEIKKGNNFKNCRMRKSYAFIVSASLGVNRFGSEHTKKRAENQVYNYYLEHDNIRLQVSQ